MSPIFFFIVLGVLLFVVEFWLLVRCSKRCGENERFAVFIHGEYRGLKGPGMIFKFPVLMNFIVIQVGDTGELVTPDRAHVKQVLLPVRVRDSSKTGSEVKIIAFEADPNGQRAVVGASEA